MNKNHKLRVWVEELQKKWCLRDWHIVIRPTRANEPDMEQFYSADSLGSIARHGEYRTATIFAGPHGHGWEPGGVLPSERYIVAHEIAHLLFWPLEDIFTDVARVLGSREANVLHGMWHQATETVCNVLAFSVTGERPEQAWKDGEK